MDFGHVDPYIMISHRLESLILDLSKIAHPESPTYLDRRTMVIAYMIALLGRMFPVQIGMFGERAAAERRSELRQRDRKPPSERVGG